MFGPGGYNRSDFAPGYPRLAESGSNNPDGTPNLYFDFGPVWIDQERKGCWLVWIGRSPHPPRGNPEATQQLTHQRQVLRLFYDHFGPTFSVLVPFEDACDVNNYFPADRRHIPHTFASFLSTVDYPVSWFLVYDCTELQCRALFERSLVRGPIPARYLRRHKWELRFLADARAYFEDYRHRDHFANRLRDSETFSPVVDPPTAEEQERAANEHRELRARLLREGVERRERRLAAEASAGESTQASEPPDNQAQERDATQQEDASSE